MFELKLNMFGQNMILSHELKSYFDSLSDEEKDKACTTIIYNVIQSKVSIDDVNDAILKSGLKETLSPCALLRKGIHESNLKKIFKLPGKDFDRAFILIVSLFAIGYIRRFNSEMNDPNKWWYWDFSDPEKLALAKQNLK